jgi:type II secretory pathway component PulM
MSRIELELYADRLARHAERLRDDVDGARLRLAWAGLEQRVRTDLGAHDAAVLEALGVLVAVDDAGERRLLERRLRQLQALERLQALVERELADLYPGRGQSSPPSSSGASDTSIPPSSS